MSANIHGKMVYSFERPMWHALTPPCLDEMSAVEVLEKRFKGGFEIFLRHPINELNGQPTIDENFYTIIRGVSPYDPQELVFGYSSTQFKPLQPREIAHSFDANVKQPVETMAFLGQGEDMFISWKMPPFEVVFGDVIELFGILRCGFDTQHGARLFIAQVRPVCQNTIVRAEGEARNNGGYACKLKATNQNLLLYLGYWMEHVQERAQQESALLQEFLRDLAMKDIPDDETAWKILYRAFPDREDYTSDIPKQLRGAKADELAETNEKISKVREGIFSLFSGDGTQITPTYWGMLCATSEYFCHVQPSKKPIAESVMWGARSKKIVAMIEALKAFE